MGDRTKKETGGGAEDGRGDAKKEGMAKTKQGKTEAKEKEEKPEIKGKIE